MASDEELRAMGIETGNNIIICEKCYEENEANRTTCKSCGAKLYKNNTTRNSKNEEKNYNYKENKYTFSNTKISVDDVKKLMKYVLFKRGNVIWLDFGFNIGNEFGGMHPAVILKNFDNDLFVVPISSKKPPEYVKIEQDFKDKRISEEECQKQKRAVTEIIELSKNIL